MQSCSDIGNVIKKTKNSKQIKLSRRLVCTALAMFVTACGQSNEAAGESGCAVREYLEQGVILDQSPSRRKAAGLTPTMTNFNAFRDNWNPWLIEGFVSRRDRKTLRLDKPSVASVAELDPHTSFLVIVAPEGFKSTNVLSKYFEGKFRYINVNEACPIYVGDRNGGFALATIRARQGVISNENYRECAILASLAYFGLPDSELSNFENYIKADLLPSMWFYDTQKIKSFLSENTKC